MADFATLLDVIEITQKEFTSEEQARITALLSIVSDRLRIYADNVGKDLDAMVEVNATLANVARSVTVDVVMRYLQTPTEGAPMSQFSEAALGYSVSGTFLVPGGGVFIKNAELKQLGLLRPKYGFIDLCGASEGGEQS